MVPERRELFAQMTVADNIEIGAYVRNDSPGIKTDLDLIYHMFPALFERRSQKADEVAAAVLYLASKSAAMVTGHILSVDGGFLAQ